MQEKLKPLLAQTSRLCVAKQKVCSTDKMFAQAADTGGSMSGEFTKQSH
jgi:hypothetical protein